MENMTHVLVRLGLYHKAALYKNRLGWKDHNRLQGTSLIISWTALLLLW